MLSRTFRTAMMALVAVVATTGISLASTGWTTGGVNFRAGPGTNYHVIGWIDRCQQIRLEYRQGGWYRISWSGRQGWIASRYVTQQRSYCGGY